MNYLISKILLLLLTSAMLLPLVVRAEETNEGDPEEVKPESQPSLEISMGADRNALVGQLLLFESKLSNLNEESISEIVWDFGDGVRTTGKQAEHSFKESGQYVVKVRVITDSQIIENASEVNVFENLIVLVADSSAPSEQLELRRQQAAKKGVLLFIIKAKSGGPEVLVEEELTSQLLDLRPSLDQAHLIVMWTSGGVGANVLTKYAQHIKQSENISIGGAVREKGIVLLSETPFAVLKPAAQSAFDQLQPSYVLLTRPQIIDSLVVTKDANEAREIVFTSPLEHKILGSFSTRVASDIRITNFLSFSVNFLINRGVPINSIILILMLPIIATILSFSRQVVGIKSFGLITPAMTTLSFLVMGLQYGMIVFLTIVLSGTLTRVLLRRLKLLYLPRMALVLTSVSLSLLLLLALGVANDQTSFLSFSIFPALIMTILAEEFISAQFKLGVRTALALTAWTLVLATICYFIVSSELFRTLILSYPEIILLTIPINIALGRWSGLRLTEYVRFRDLLKYGNNAS